MQFRTRLVLRSLCPLSFVGCLVLAACGGNKPEPNEPEPPAATPSDESSEGSAEATPSSEESTSAASSDPKEEPPAAPLRTPKDIVTGEGVLFMFSFAASEAHDKAEEQCDAKSGDDPQKKAACMTKASEQIEADGIAFQQDEEGKWWWLTIRRKGSGLNTLHKVEFDFGDEKDKSVTIKPKGRDKGTKPMGNIPKEVVIEVPSESQIAIVDPKHGRMVYEAKLGLLGEAKAQ